MKQSLTPNEIQRFFNQSFAGEVPNLHQSQIVEHICVCKHATQILRQPIDTCLFHTCPNCKHWHTIMFTNAVAHDRREELVAWLIRDYLQNPRKFF